MLIHFFLPFCLHLLFISFLIHFTLHLHLYSLHCDSVIILHFTCILCTEATQSTWIDHFTLSVCRSSCISWHFCLSVVWFNSCARRKNQWKTFIPLRCVFIFFFSLFSIHGNKSHIFWWAMCNTLFNIMLLIVKRERRSKTITWWLFKMK